MDVFEAIRTRRSIGKVREERPPREVIEKMLEAATWAPNHHSTEPWRFFVMTGEARNSFGEILVESLREKFEAEGKELTAERAEKERGIPLRAPVVIAVAVEKPEGPKVLDIENVCAAAAAIQNMLLVAHAHGLAAIWRTGGPAYDPKAKAFFGLEPDQHIAGFVYVGYPAMDPPEKSRRPFDQKTTWLGWG